MGNSKNFVLVPVNFTDYADNGAVYALQIAAGINADVILINAYYIPVLSVPVSLEPYAYTIRFENDLQKMEEETLLNLEATKQMLDELKEQKGISDVSVNIDMVQGYAAETVLAYANEYKPAAIIMGTHGSEPNLSTPFGKTSAQILEKATVPVIAVPFGYDAYKFNKPKKVIYITNLDNTDYHALERLVGFANFFNTNIICIHTSAVETDKTEEEKMRGIKNHIIQHFDNTAVECGILESADIQSGLEKFIKERDADVLAFSTHKRNLFLQFFTRHTSRSYLYQTGIPLLVYHS